MSIPSTMRAVLCDGSGGLSIGRVPLPELTSTHPVLVKVSHTALNRADMLQRAGKYPPPRGASEILGLECVGEVVTPSGPWKAGDRIMGLLEGGGYAEYVAAAPGSLMPAPAHLADEEAACIPEVWLTAWQLLTKVANQQPKERVLLHAGSSAVSLAAAQVALKKLNASEVVAITRSAEKKSQVEQVGAQWVHRDEIFVPVDGDCGSFSSDGGAPKPTFQVADQYRDRFDVILDPVVGPCFFPCLSQATRRDARYVVYAAMGGPKITDFNFGPVFRKSLDILSSTLRARSLGYKADLITSFRQNVLETGSGNDTNKTFAGGLLISLDSVFPVEDVSKAFDRMSSNANVGKIVLKF